MPPIQLRHTARRLGGEMVRELWACRTLNLAVALLGLVLAAPLMLIVALVVRLTSPGPVIFRQQRVGIDRRRHRGSSSVGHRRRSDHGGEVFTIYKFRTMRVAKETAEVWAARNDVRITSVGRFLRATRLDELPQLVNVVKGDMNLVGPRPEQPGIFATLAQEVFGYRVRQRVRPGITGLAQVKLGYDTDLEGVRRKVALDLEYIRRRSPVSDLMIMAKTVPVVLLRKVWV